MYELNGQEVTLEFLQGKAKEYDMDFDSYLETMKTKGLVEKTKDVAETGAAVASETTAPDVSASSSVASLLELPTYTDNPETAKLAQESGFSVLPGARQEGDTIIGVMLPEAEASPLTFQEQLDKEKLELESKVNNFETDIVSSKKVLEDFEKQNLGDGAIEEPTQATVDEYNSLVKSYNDAIVKGQDEIQRLSSEYDKRVEEFNKAGENQKITAKQSIKNSFSNLIQDGKNVVDFYFGEGVGLDLATDQIYRSIFGDERVDSYIERNKDKPFLIEGLLTDEQRVQKIKDFEAKQQDRKETLGIIESFGEGTITEKAASILSAITNVGGSVIYNAGTAGTGYFMDFAAQNYIDYNSERAKLKGKTLEELIQAGEDDGSQAIKLASLQAGAEYFGYSKIKKALGGKMPVPKLMPKKVRDKFNYNPKAKTTLNILTTGTSEAATEIFQGGIEEYNKKSAADPDISFTNTIVEYAQSPEGMEAGVQGFVGAGGLTTGSYSARAVSQARKSVDGLQVEKQINEILSITEAIEKTKDETVRQGLEAQRDIKSQQLSERIKKGNDLYKTLSDGDISELEEIHDIADVQAARAVELQKKFNDGKISESEYKLALEGYRDAYEAAEARATQLLADKTSEVVEKQIKELEKVGVKGKLTKLSTADIASDQSLGDMAEQASREYGFIKQFGDGTFEIIVNTEKQPKLTEVHELGHALLFNTIGNNKEIQDNLGDALVEHVSKIKGDKTALGEKLANYGEFNEQGEFIRDANFGEEVIVSMSELVADGSLKFEENFFTKVGDVIRRFLQNAGLKEVRLDTGRDVFNFVKDYTASISEGKINRAIIKAAAEGAKGKLVEGRQDAEGATQFSKESPLEAINKILPQDIKTKEQYDNFVNDPRKGAELFNSIIQPGGVINNYIRSRQLTKEEGDKMIERVTDRILGFNPEETRADGSVVGREGFGERIFADTRFAKLDAKKALALEAERTKREETIDTPEARQLVAEGDVQVTPTEDVKKSKINILQDFVGVPENKIVSLAKPVEGDTFKQIIKKYAGKTGELIFNIPAKKIMEGGANLIPTTKIKEGMAVPSEALQIQKFLNAQQNLENFVKTLPLYNVTEMTADINRQGENIDVSRDTYGTAIGLKGLPLDYFYEGFVDPTGVMTSPKGRSKGLTSQTPVKKLKQKFRKPTKEVLDQLKKDLGITPAGQKNEYNRNIGQLLKGTAKVYSINAALSGAQRNQEAKLKTAKPEDVKAIKQQTADITAAQSKIAFSKAEGAKTFNMVEKPSDVEIPLVSIQLLKDLLEGKTRTGFRDMDAEFEPGVTFDQKASEIANKFLNQSPEVKSLIENTMTGGVRGGLFLTKPEFNKRIKVKDIKDVSEKLKSYRYNYNSEKRLTKKAVESFNDKDIVADRNARLDILHNFWKDVETYLKDNKQDQWFFEALVRDTSRGQQALTRVLAPFRGYAVDKNGKPVYNLEVVEEHSKPQNNVSYAYLNAAIEGKVDELKPVIEASYMQISLLKTDDKAIAAAGLEQTMPDVYFDFIVPKIKSGELKFAPGMAAAVRLAAVGTPYAPKVSDKVIDLNNIYMPELGQTIAQHFGIDKIKDVKAANILLIEELAGINFENTKLPEAQISKAISNTRAVNMYSKAARGMSTFDFDETLIIEGENFIVATKGDDVQRISSGDWPLLGPTLADEGYSFDFTDFVNVRGGVDGPLLQKMKNQIKKYGTQNVFVLTARPAESATAIHEWLKTKGINIPFENITGLGNSTGDAKAAWFLDKYAEGYNDMYFVDDAMPNVDAVKHVFDQLDIKGKSVQAKVKFSKSEYDTNKDPYSFVNFKTVPKEIVNSKSYKKWIKSLEGMKLFHGTTTDPNKISELGTNHSLNWFIVGGNNNQKAIALTKRIEREYDDEAENSVLSIDASELAGRILPDADFIGPSDDMSISKDKTFQNKIKALEDKYKTTARVQPMIRKPKMYAEFLDIITEHNPMSGYSQVLFDKNGKLNVNSAVVIVGGLKPNQLKVESISDPTTAIAPKFSKSSLRGNKAVKNVLNQLDVKGKSVQAKIQFSKSLSNDFNKMLERTKGIGAEKIFSRIGAQKRGKNVGRFTFFVPPSADDFAGLLRYFVGKGEQGNKDLDFFNKALIKPFARADRDMKEARQSILDDHKALRKEMPQVVKKLGKMIDDSGFTFDNAIRVYLWDKAGFDIPGLSKRDIAFLTNRVKTDQDLKTYADIIGLISKQKEGYIEPSEYWNVESIASDLQNVVNKQGRKKFLAEWKENVDIIFSPENLNKIEAAYGSNFREALENILWRMENGTNRAKGMGRLEGAWNNWVNNSVGAIMFFNARSAVLQTLSTVNFINFEDNNIFAAAKAFANQKQYWKDFSFLFNSDFLKQRRAGLQTNINEAEIASAVAGAANKAKAALQYLLKQGFLPTQIADSFAIASGGATYYRNRVKKYVKQGLSQTEAETQAMEDFMEIAEETQQSARPDRISQQQASSLGRIILAFANTPMQYARLIKKAAGDLVKGRGDWRSNVSRIIYYGAIQNIIFSSLQSAIFALAFDDEEPEQDEIDTKVQRTLNGMIDSLLRGSGLAGAVVSTLKNVINRFIQESEKKSRADYGNVLVDALNVSPPIGSKSRKLYNATKTYKYNREVMGEMNTFDLENPVWDAVGNVVSATTNLPLDRGFRKIDNMKEALNQDNETWQRVAVGLGWDQWSLGIDSRKEVQEARELIKEKKKEEKKKSQQRCTKIKSDGTRCKIMVNKPKTRCHYHD